MSQGLIGAVHGSIDALLGIHKLLVLRLRSFWGLEVKGAFRLPCLGILELWAL